MKTRLVCLAMLAMLQTPLPASAQPACHDDPGGVLCTMQKLRPLYKGSLDRRTAGDFLNRVAWRHRGEKLALLGKKTGNNCDMPDGQLISCDFLVYSDTKKGQDALIAWDAAGTPSWGDHFVDLTEAIKSGARSIVPPQVPPDLPGDPGPGPGPVEPPNPPVDPRVDQLAAAVERLAAEVAALRADNEALRSHAAALAKAINDNAKAQSEAVGAVGARIPTGCASYINVLGRRIQTGCSLTQ